MINRNEHWKDVVGYEGYYQVSNHGNVRSVDRIIYVNRGSCSYQTEMKGHQLIIAICKHGYQYVTFSKEGKSKKFKVHRLIAIHFIPNPNNHELINHINGIRDDNRIHNIEWCDHSHNMKHKFLIGNDSNEGAQNAYSKKVIQLSTGFIFDTIKEAAKAFGVHHQTLSDMITGVIRRGRISKNRWDLSFTI
jgi:hypothetical protein